MNILPALEKSVHLETEEAGRDLRRLFQEAFVIQEIKSIKEVSMSTGTVKALWALLSVTALMVVIAAFPVSGLTQDKPGDNMQILREKIKADKKLVVAANLELTESEAKGFWPVYEQYQKDLATLNQRIVKLSSSRATPQTIGQRLSPMRKQRSLLMKWWPSSRLRRDSRPPLFLSCVRCCLKGK